MTTTIFIGVKGGVGTSTVAAFHALELAERTGSVRLTATNSADLADLAAILGVPAPTPGDCVQVVPGLTLGDSPATLHHTVVDGGTDMFSDRTGAVLVVLRNDSLSLRRALNVPRNTLGIVLVNDTHRALGRRDIEDAIPHPIVAKVRVDTAIARSIDAGLIAASRRHRLALDVPEWVLEEMSHVKAGQPERLIGYVDPEWISPMAREYFPESGWPQLSPYFEDPDSGEYFEARPYAELTPDEAESYPEGWLRCTLYSADCVEGRPTHCLLIGLTPIGPTHFRAARTAGWKF